MTKIDKQPEAAIRFDRVSVRLGGVVILEDVSVMVPRGGWTAVVGPNGAGKTTLLLAMLGEISFQGIIQGMPNGKTTGPRFLDSRKQGDRGATPSELNRRGQQDASASASGGPVVPPKVPRLGYVPQRLVFDRGMPLTVIEFLAMGEQRRPLWLGIKREARERAMEALNWVRAGQLARRRLGALSGGELQRVLLALAILQKPDLLVLDEPAAGVDLHGGLVFCELLETLRQERGFTLLMVSHDLSIVSHHATHVICLNRKVIAEGAPQEVLNSKNLTALFGMHMGLVDAHSVTFKSGACTCDGCREGKHD